MTASVDVVVYTAGDTWADSQRRGFYSTADQTVLSLIDSPVVRRVIVVDAPRGILSQIRRRLANDRPSRHSGKLRGVRPWVISTKAGSNARSIARRYTFCDLQIRMFLFFSRVRQPVLLSFDLLHVVYGNRRWASKVIFYAQDNEAEIERLAYRRDLTYQAYSLLPDRVDRLIAVSTALVRSILPSNHLAATCMVVANGVDPELWQLPREDVSRSHSTIRAVYVGTIDRRLCHESVGALSEAGFSVYLAGPVADADTEHALLAMPRVHLLGSQTRHEVAQLIRSADLCVLPHRSSLLTETMSPLKLFEYLASGIPVVASDLAGIREAWPQGNLARSPAEFVSLARKAITQVPIDEADRLALLAEISWRERHARLLELLIE